MRFLLWGMVGCLASTADVAGCEIRWPNPAIQVPPLVQSYIVAECQSYEGFSEESVQECILGEGYGYRAVVAMLADSEYGDGYAARYRMCSVGLGDLGGRFHRRKAECMATVFLLVWRFEFTRQASVGQPDMSVDPEGHRYAQAEVAPDVPHTHLPFNDPHRAAAGIALN